jgi:hypothetical protein
MSGLVPVDIAALGAGAFFGTIRYDVRCTMYDVECRMSNVEEIRKQFVLTIENMSLFLLFVAFEQ